MKLDWWACLGCLTVLVACLVIWAMVVVGSVVLFDR